LNHSEFIRSAHKEEITRGNGLRPEKVNVDTLNAAMYGDIASGRFLLARESPLVKKQIIL
jgi:hypothetical protein